MPTVEIMRIVQITMPIVKITMAYSNFSTMRIVKMTTPRVIIKFIYHQHSNSCIMGIVIHLLVA